MLRLITVILLAHTQWVMGAGDGSRPSSNGQKRAKQLNTWLRSFMPPAPAMVKRAVLQKIHSVELISLSFGHGRRVNRKLVSAYLATVTDMIHQSLPCPEHAHAHNAMHFSTDIAAPYGFDSMSPAAMGSTGLRGQKKPAAPVTGQGPAPGAPQIVATCHTKSNIPIIPIIHFLEKGMAACRRDHLTKPSFRESRKEYAPLCQRRKMLAWVQRRVDAEVGQSN